MPTENKEVSQEQIGETLNSLAPTQSADSTSNDFKSAEEDDNSVEESTEKPEIFEPAEDERKVEVQGANLASETKEESEEMEQQQIEQDQENEVNSTSYISEQSDPIPKTDDNATTKEPLDETAEFLSETSTNETMKEEETEATELETTEQEPKKDMTSEANKTISEQVDETSSGLDYEISAEDNNLEPTTVETLSPGPELPPTSNKPSPPELPLRDDELIMINSEDVPHDSQLDDEPSNMPTSPMNKQVNNFKKWFNFSNLKSENNSSDNLTDNMKLLSHPENYNLALLRFQENSESLLSKSIRDQESVNTSADRLRKTFNEIRTGIEFTNDNQLIQGIDWEFWSEVVNDYSSVVKNEPEELLKHITRGVPRELRGMIWQLICNSKSLHLEEFYRNSKSSTSEYEKLIKRDLARTSFVTNGAVKSKIDDLFEIIKVYSLFDSQVGYTQGMAFITVPLLMNMEASEAFCMLSNLMMNYGFRDLYLPEMPGLHIKLYQFDRLLEDLIPDLHVHLKRQGVRSSMYATQWFLTLFGYKFPLEMVLRIYDIVIAEGIESILKFAVNLMMMNQQHLLTLRFDELLSFLKDKLFFFYVDNSSSRQDSGSKGNNSARHLADAYSNKEITIDSYKLEEFVNDSMSINILPISLRRYEAEYEEIHRLEKERDEEIEELRTRNGQLTREIRHIEAAYATLNREHVEIANEMVEGKVQIANFEDENQQLQKQIEELTDRLSHLEKQTDTKIDFSGEISNNMELEIHKTMERNLEVMEENRVLEEQISKLENEYAEVKQELDELKTTSGKWGLKKKAFW